MEEALVQIRRYHKETPEMVTLPQVFDFTQNKLILNPEYGGDGKEVGRCTQFKPPIAVYPAYENMSRVSMF